MAAAAGAASRCCNAAGELFACLARPRAEARRRPVALAKAAPVGNGRNHRTCDERTAASPKTSGRMDKKLTHLRRIIFLAGVLSGVLSR
jgi:hypothetical protein